MRFLDVRTDYAFKKVFGSDESKDILISFLNAAIDFADGVKIQDLTIVDPYQIPLIKGMKDSYVDVKAVLSDNRRIIVEMQVLNVEGFEKRVLYNAAKAYSMQLGKSQPYSGLEPIIALTITDFEMFEDIRSVISYFRLIEKQTLITYSDDIELIFIELPKFVKKEDELETITDKWIYFIKHAGSLDMIPKGLDELPINKAFQIANVAGLSEEELEIQHKRRDFIWMQRGALEKAKKEGRQEGLKEGLKEGLEKGRKEGAEEGRKKGMTEAKAEIVLKLKKKQTDIHFIAEITGLTTEEILDITE